ncbi:hypothetical protein PHYBLDRAFT_167794 [Phycomyces blakesleeanus NRRL 1555(-)]|uniref:Uncharacterized protein n=1 Tax=Phycomyces blakesleeanus (strain ATCC 8743b / DSM 1359 / FGSC 10004 / NBRC 33097 / NRRL 1555) TaxID=763407 RepID=A0A162NHT3_PHYB8|nr:hypothetical protein PHYBLDRAFT_167794 [Phycomyces blakesleeanus NRRL 1555(-)]OAD74378.1 hypothetical protein PHYBLDRAFT_167794 [Phycomyces blakesleeanus NRRL 1555(-)]|eukprot:XP_018292418.1 hypothetical protein PHYBLDRAFT_167794 [Phycomyces blakesleeanus NRRL 1555(-)]
MAAAIIRSTRRASLDRQQVQELYGNVNKSRNIKLLLESILNHFGQVNIIGVLNNDKLNEISEQLACLLAACLSPGNKNFVVPAIFSQKGEITKVGRENVLDTSHTCTSAQAVTDLYDIDKLI